MKVAVVCLALAGAGVVPAETFESRGFGRLEVGFEELGGGATKTTFTAETPELAARTAAKRRVDLLSYGDLKEVAPNVLQLAGTGSWTLSVSGKVFTETFDPKAAHSQSPNPPIKQSNNSPYPAWMDAFDRYGTTIWLGGGGTGYRPDDFEWLKKMDFGFCASMTGEDLYFAPGEFDSSLYDWYEAMSRKYGLPWRLLSAGHTTWYWNNRPLPYVQPYDERFVGNSGFYYQNDQISGDGSRPIAGAGYVPFHHDFYATSTAALRDSNAMGWQASPEVPNGNINWLAACAKTPGVVRYWHQWLREVEGRSLADLGRRYFGDAAHYASWDDVAVPVPLDFLGHDPARDIDLFGEWEMTASTNAPNWTKGMCNDAAIFIHRGSWATHTHADLDEFFLRRTFTVPEEKLASSRYLHLATAAFSAHYTPYPDVWVNGVQVPSVEQRSVKKLTSDWAHCFDIGAALRPGENTILVNTLGNPIPGFAFLNGTRLRHYPNMATEGLNLRWYDACNFGSWLRTRAIVERARAFRAADRERPLKLMAIHSAQDMIIDLCRKYGMYQHDTGGSGAFWGPYTGSFLGRSHGLAWSCEQAGPPKDARNVQHQMSLYLNYGNDAVDAVFAVAHYTGKPDVKAWCEENSELLHTFGKLHQPRQELAILRSSRCQRQGLESPLNWDIGRGTLQAIGRSFVYLEIPDLHDDALVGAYPVVWDCSTELLLPEDAKAIRRYAERGGTFIALHSTGRHLPERADAWPLAAEFGLTIKDKMLKPGENMHRQPLGPITFAKDQDLFPALAGKTISGSGVAIDCTGREHTGGIGISGRAVPVATWDDDGTMAVAEVKVGRGRVIFLGSTFMTRSRDERGVWMSRGAMNAHLDTMLTRCGVPRRSVTSNHSFWATPWESKNGVYDVYMTTRLQGNGDGKLTNAVYSASFKRTDPIRTVRNMGVKGHPEVPVAWKDGAFALPDDVYEPMQTRVFAAPRADAGRAALRWIRNWCEIWHPLNLKDEETPAALPKDPNVIALRDGWEGGVAPALWGTLGLEDSAKRTFRTTVKVPEEWRGSRIELVATCGRVQRGFYPYGEIKVNGEGLPGLCPFRGMQGAFSVDVTDAAKTGSFTLEVMVDGSVCKGVRSRPTGAGATFVLRRWPTSRGEKALEGPWFACEDLDRKTEIKVGDRVKHTYFETTFTVPPEAKGARIFLSSPVPLRGLILNNRMMNAEETMKDLDVTGLVRTDGPNLLRRACADLKGFHNGARTGMVHQPTNDPLPPMKLWWTDK